MTLERLRLDGKVACATGVAGLGRRGAVLRVDVTSDQAVRRMVDEAVGVLGGLDILVNSIDLAFAKPLVETTAEEWTRTLTTNLTAVFLTTKYAAQHMLRSGKGKIVNVTSQLGERGLPNASAYCAAKGGVVLLTKAAALEWGQHGISVNGKMWVDIETQGEPSRWVTLRALHILQAAQGE